MIKLSACAFLVVGLALPSTLHATALNVFVEGRGHQIEADAFGHDVSAELDVAGVDNRVDFFEGPCALVGHSRTSVRESGARRVVVAPCP